MFAEAGESGLGGPLDLITVPRIWPNYFPQVEFSLDDRKFKLVALLVDFFSTPQSDPLLSRVQDDCGIFFLPINMQQFQKICGANEFYTILDEAPKEALLCMGAAVHMVLSMKKENYHLEDIEKINIRLYNHPDSLITLKNLKASYIGKLVSVRGSVVKVSTVRPLVLQMDFVCGKCGTVITRIFPDGKFSPPVACTIQGCRSRTFNPIRSSAKPIDFQKIRHELHKSGSHEEGRVPRTVECELTEDLVDSCIPGDVITVTGIIKVINNYMDIGGGRSKSKNQGLYYLYLEAVSVRNSKSQSTEDVQENNSKTGACVPFDFFSFSPRDLEFVVKFSEEHGSDIFRQILHSFCPSIYGHELVKAGIVLALFGGVQKHSVDQNKVPVRGDIHVIVVGDPGLGKSQLLQAATAISPRGIYVCGNATTNAGLTVAVVKDPMTSDYAFEAGSLGSHGTTMCLCCKGWVGGELISTNLCFSSSKSCWRRAKTVNENLRMSAALLSRFDLVFILLDRPDELQDKRVSDHIMALHTRNTDHLLPTKKQRRALQSDKNKELSVPDGKLASRLRLDPVKDKDFVPLPGPLIRKYIAYARNFVTPRMSRPAAEILQKFYLRLRDRSTSADGTPITARQLESLVRLAEARARLDLREEITAEDATDVVEIMKESLYDKYVDEHGYVDFARSGGMSQQKEAKRFLSALNKQSELQQKDCFSISEIYSLADKISLRVPDIDAFVDNLNSIGYLLKKGPKTYQVVSSSYSHSQSTRSRC
ncbi:putative DNA helicase MCM8 isoform X1 [Canna indica]|uniref:Probable DNA helicase MCM8 n=1 Tax=Canna indica TaxID=4628 RepID=A0AAQ3K8Z0_9LILI|nr:putative DNA helicase MCM8 isoform X1 [Canna indica]